MRLPPCGSLYRARRIMKIWPRSWRDSPASGSWRVNAGPLKNEYEPPREFFTLHTGRCRCMRRKSLMSVPPRHLTKSRLRKTPTAPIAKAGPDTTGFERKDRDCDGLLGLRVIVPMSAYVPARPEVAASGPIAWRWPSLRWPAPRFPVPGRTLFPPGPATWSIVRPARQPAVPAR